MVKKILFLVVFFLSIGITTIEAKKGNFTLVIDAGHGGKDTGALGSISKEKDINLNVALAFGRYVEQNLPSVNVIYTRTTDVFLTLKERAGIANRAKADLFISVHTNSLPPGRSAKGFQVYTLGMHKAKDNLDVAMRENKVISLEGNHEETYEGFNPSSSESYILFEFIQSANMEKSVELARLIQNSVCRTANRIDKGVHQAGFLVLRETSMPSCLIELGFITSQEEEEFLNSSEGIDLIARGIYEAFASYKKMYDDNVTIPFRTVNNQPMNVGRVLPNADLAVAPKAIEKKRVERSDSRAKNKAKTEKPKAKIENVAGKTSKSVRNMNVPVFKIQVLTSNKQLRSDDKAFKGYGGVEYIKEGNSYIYTIGASENYNEINRLYKKAAGDFPGAFIIATKEGKRVNVNDAIKEFLTNKGKK